MLLEGDFLKKRMQNYSPARLLSLMASWFLRAFSIRACSELL